MPGGALVSATDLTVGDNSTVNGDIIYCEELDIGKHVVINGNVTPPCSVPFPPQNSTEELAQAFKDRAMAGGTWPGNMVINDTQSVNLESTYITGNLIIGRDLTITLGGIVYVGGNISCEKELTVTGNGSIVAEGYISILKLTLYEVGDDTIIMSLDDHSSTKDSGIHAISIMKFVNDASATALIYAPNGEVYFGNECVIYGSVIANSIRTKDRGVYTYAGSGWYDFFDSLRGGLETLTYTINP
jgi:cytoskeletal protein CcmA (bactofilin family)